MISLLLVSVIRTLLSMNSSSVVGARSYWIAFLRNPRFPCRSIRLWRLSRIEPFC